MILTKNQPTKSTSTSPKTSRLSTVSTSTEKYPKKTANAPCQANFEPYKGKIRKAGTGGIYQISDNLFEGRYSPTNAHGKREIHTVYAKTREECEKLLEEMIPKVRAEIKAEKDRLKAEQN